MIQSKPRGSEVASLESHQDKMNSNRSISKQNHMLSTQAKKDGGSDAEVDVNSSDGNIDADGNKSKSPRKDADGNYQ